MASFFKKIGTGLKKATKAVGTGIANAAKYTAKNPLKVLAPIALVGGTLLTGGALAPALAGKLAATKVGGTLFGKMVTKTMQTGTIVRSKIEGTLKKQGKKATKSEVDLIEKGLQEEVKKRKGFKLPVDKVSKSGTEARAKLKEIEAQLMEKSAKLNPEIQATLEAERQVLIDNPNTNGILSRSELDEETLIAMKNAGSVKDNLLGKGFAIADLLGLNPEVSAKAKSALDIIKGESNDPFLSEDMDSSVRMIEAKQNQSAFGGGLMGFIKSPIVIVLAIAGVVYYFFIKK